MRLRRNADFQFVYRRGKSTPSSKMVLLVAHRRGISKVGFSCGKKVGNSVVRNRVKRYMKEAYRLMARDIKDGYRLVFIARKPMEQADFRRTYDTMQGLLKKRGVLKDNLNELKRILIGGGRV